MRPGPTALRAACFAGGVGLSLGWATPADARGDRFLVEPPGVEGTLAYRYAEMRPEDCLAQLDARKVPYERFEATAGVDTPVILTGPLRGVTFKPSYRPPPDSKIPLSTIADCRLAVGIDDLALLLHEHGVVEAEYLSMYRRRGLGFIKPGRRHPAGLAIDLATVTLGDGTKLSVQYDFHGRVGAQTCGEKASPPTKDTPGARFWREIACGLADQTTFNLVLTPNYDGGHNDHFHLEVRTGIRWVLYH